MKTKNKSGRYLLLAAFLIAILVPVTRQQLKARDYIQALAPGVMLEAVRHRPGPLFRDTRVLLLGYSDQGATGVVMGEPLAQGFARYQEPPAVDPAIVMERFPDSDVFWGGPVALAEPYRILLDPGALSFTMVAPDSPETTGVLSPIAHSPIYMGYAGWSPGQLENELRRGDWKVKALSRHELLVLLHKEQRKQENKS